MRATFVLYGQGSNRGLSSRVPSRRKAMLRNMVSSLLEHERIETTLTKAKMAQVYAERMITLGKKGTLLHKRKALAFVRGETLVHKLFHDLAARYAARPGGYTRVVRTRRRYGDNAQMAFLELVDGPHERKQSPLYVPSPLPLRVVLGARPRAACFCAHSPLPPSTPYRNDEDLLPGSAVLVTPVPTGAPTMTNSITR
jgi:large subunit ribosomal protein L17